MPYTLKFSDPTKDTSVVVPDMPPGINAVDTSLSLVGKGYPNYGQKYAENFLHLLENFSGPYPPQNPIEGQLWYDTSDPTNKVLRVMDGTSTAARWPNATGIYQQPTNPLGNGIISLRLGDIWVDTANNQLKIFNSANWTVVGPSTSTNSGPFVTTIADNKSPIPNLYEVVETRVNDTVISIESGAAFIPNPTIPGFTALVTGTNISSYATINGRASSASALAIASGNSNIIVSADKFLRKDVDQVINGKIVFQNHDPLNLIEAQGRDGIIINTSSDDSYVQLYKNNTNNDAILVNNGASGKILFKVKVPGTNRTVLTIDNGIVAINTSTTAGSPALDVYGTARIWNTLTVVSTQSSAVVISGGVSVAGTIDVGTDVQVTGDVSVDGMLLVGLPSGSDTAIQPASTGTYDIGSSALPFRDIYATGRIGTTSSVIYGTLATMNNSGMIMAYGTSTNIPFSWLLCDGAQYPRASYQSLYNVIGYTYGGSGANFNVPDMRSSTTSTVGYISYIIKT